MNRSPICLSLKPLDEKFHIERLLGVEAEPAVLANVSAHHA